MTDEASLLRAIRAAPDDELLHLAYADLLEEQGNPARAEFVRLQCALEPLRDDYVDPEAVTMREREREMLREHRATWFGPLDVLAGEYPEYRGHAVFLFRRGVIEGARLPVRTFLERGEEMVRWFPALRKLTLYEAHGQGAELARCPHLRHLRRLELADWVTGADAEALAGTDHLADLRMLQIWLGSEQDEAVCRALARPGVLPRLHDLRLVQLLGGLMAEPADRELAERADRQANVADRVRGEALASVERPFERLFPLRDWVYDGLSAGRLPDGSQALAIEAQDSLHLALFNEEGELIEVGTEPSWRPLAWDHTGNGQFWVAQILEHLKREIGLEAGLIRVKEFSTEDVGLRVQLFPDSYEDVLKQVDDSSKWPRRGEGDCAQIHRWLEGENFVIDWGNDMWAGPDGRVHST